MFENIANFFKRLIKSETKETTNSKDTAKERLHLVLMQDRANVSADFLELMKQEIIEVIKKYIEVEETAIDVRLTNEIGEDGTKGAPSLYANIPILNIKNNIKKEDLNNEKKENITENKKEANKEKKNEKAEDNEAELQEKKKEDKQEKDEEYNKENKDENEKDNNIQKSVNKEENDSNETKKDDKKEVKEKSKNVSANKNAKKNKQN